MFRVAEIECRKTVGLNVSPELPPPSTKEGVPQVDAVGEVGGRQGVEEVGRADGEEVLCTNFWGERKVVRCVVDERQRNELHQRHEVARMNQRNVENQDENLVVRMVDARDFHLVQV